MIGLSYCLYFLPAIFSLQSMSSLESLLPVKLTLSNFTNLRKSLSVELSNPDMAKLALTANLHLYSSYISLLRLGLELITSVLQPEQTEKNNANIPLCFGEENARNLNTLYFLATRFFIVLFWVNSWQDKKTPLLNWNRFGKLKLSQPAWPQFCQWNLSRLHHQPATATNKSGL